MRSNKNKDVKISLVKMLAEELVENADLRGDFEGAVHMFLAGELERLNERTSPPLPENKFVPREIQIIDFLRQEWGEWIDRGLLTKPILKQHDRRAYDALMNWARNNDLSQELDIPTQMAANDRFLSRGYFTQDEAHRVVGILSRRP